MKIPVILVGVIFIFDCCDSNTTPHTYGSQFYGTKYIFIIFYIIIMQKQKKKLNFRPWTITQGSIAG